MNGSAQFLGITYAEAARWEDPLIKPLSSVVATTEPKGYFHGINPKMSADMRFKYKLPKVYFGGLLATKCLDSIHKF